MTSEDARSSSKPTDHILTLHMLYSHINMHLNGQPPYLLINILFIIKEISLNIINQQQ